MSIQMSCERFGTVDKIVTAHDAGHLSVYARPECRQVSLRHIPRADLGVEFEARDAGPLLEGVACEVLARRANFEQPVGCLL